LFIKLLSCADQQKLDFVIIDHQPIVNHPFPHRVNALFHDLYSISLSSVTKWFETQIQLRIIREAMSIRKIMFYDLKQLGHIFALSMSLEALRSSSQKDEKENPMYRDALTLYRLVYS